MKSFEELKTKYEPLGIKVTWGTTACYASYVRMRSANYYAYMERSDGEGMIAKAIDICEQMIEKEKQETTSANKFIGTKKADGKTDGNYGDVWIEENGCYRCINNHKKKDAKLSKDQILSDFKNGFCKEYKL